MEEIVGEEYCGPESGFTLHCADDPAIPASGTCGENLTWTLDGDGNLVISGTGAMTDWVAPNAVPWFSHRADILTLSFPDGITSIGSSAFDGCSALADVYYSGTRSQWSAVSIAEDGNAPLLNATFHCAEPEVPVTFSVPVQKACCGRTVTVPVNITDNPGLASVTLTINYDPSVLEYTGAQFSSAFTSLPGSSSLVNPQNGKVTLTWVVTSGECDADGTFAELSFTVLADAAEGASPVTITYNPNSICDEALENVPAQAENGAVNVSRRLPGDVNGDDEVNNKDALLTLRYVAQFTVDADIDAMDVNADGSVDAKDALLLLRYAAGFDVVLQ